MRFKAYFLPLILILGAGPALGADSLDPAPDQAKKEEPAFPKAKPARPRAISRQDSSGRDSTWPVCSKSAGNTAQGLCDMAGNVSEWTQDWYHDTYNGAPRDGRAWESPAGSYRVFRGGSWRFVAGFARAARRLGDVPAARVGLLGFRPSR